MAAYYPRSALPDSRLKIPRKMPGRSDSTDCIDEAPTGLHDCDSIGSMESLDPCPCAAGNHPDEVRRGLNRLKNPVKISKVETGAAQNPKRPAHNPAPKTNRGRLATTLFIFHLLVPVRWHDRTIKPAAMQTSLRPSERCVICHDFGPQMRRSRHLLSVRSHDRK